MPKTWDEIINRAGREGDQAFWNEVGSLVKLTVAEIKECIPADVDNKKFAELMKLVKDTTKKNHEKAEAIRNVKGFAEIAANLLTKL